MFRRIVVLGAALAGLAGLMAGPTLAIESGMGDPILILTFVVIVIGGIGSVRGAFVAAIVVGLADTMGRALLPTLLRTWSVPRRRTRPVPRWRLCSSTS